MREKTQTALDQIECWHNRLSQSGLLLKQANESWNRAAKIVNQSASTTLVVTMDDLAAILKSKDIQRLGIEGAEGEFNEIIENVKVECDKIAGVAQKIADSGYQEDDSQREDVGQFQLDINLLGVGEDYDLPQLKKAHKFAMFSFHPDNPHNAGDRKSIATQRTQEINAAYDRLKNHLS